MISTEKVKRLCSIGEKGTHAMLVYNKIETFREAYCATAKTILDDGGVLLILTYFESPEAVNFYLRDAGVDVDYYRRSGWLHIIDSVEQFFNSSAREVIHFIELLNKRALRQGKNGITVIIDMDALFHFKIRDQYVKFESLIKPKSNKFSCLLCVYQQKNFDSLGEEMKKFLYQRHSRITVIGGNNNNNNNIA